MSNKKTKKSGLAPAAFASDPMAQIDALIKEAKRLKKNQDKINKPKKRFDKGGSNMAKKNFSSKELIKEEGRKLGLARTVAGAQKRKPSEKTFFDAKRKKELAAVSREDMKNAGFTSFGTQSLRKYLNMKNKLGKKPTKSDFTKSTKTDTKKTTTPKKKNLTSTSVGAGAVKTIAGTAAAKSVTEINRKLREKAKGEKKTETKTETKKSRGRVKKDAIKTGFLPKVAGVDIFTKKMRETADAAANKRAPNYMKKDDKKSDNKKRSKSLFKRITGTFMSPEKKSTQKPTVTSQYKKEMSYNMGGSVKVKMSKGGFKGIF